jgi:hypothetical protein
MRVRMAERIVIGVSPSRDGITQESYHISGATGKIILGMARWGRKIRQALKRKYNVDIIGRICFYAFRLKTT